MIDERFLMHRLKSTSLAGVVSAVSMGSYTMYELMVHHKIHADLIVFLGLMATVKVVSMLYLHFRN